MTDTMQTEEAQWGWDPPLSTYGRIPLRRLQGRPEWGPVVENDLKRIGDDLARTVVPLADTLRTVFDNLAKLLEPLNKLLMPTMQAVDKFTKELRRFLRAMGREYQPYKSLSIQQMQKLRRHSRGPHWKRRKVGTITPLRPVL